MQSATPVQTQNQLSGGSQQTQAVGGQSSGNQTVSTPYGNFTQQQLIDKAQAHGYSQQQIDIYKQMYGNSGAGVATMVPNQQQPYTFNGQQRNVSNLMQTSNNEIFPSDSDSTIVRVNEHNRWIRYKVARAKRLNGFDTIPGKLEYFGYDIFSEVPEAFKPTAVGPVDPGYMVGPGDVLLLSMWGQVEFQYELTVSNEGKIFIPVAGQIFVAGTSFEKLQDKIKNVLSKHYSGLATDPPRTFMDLTVSKLRPVRIFFMGEVDHPGGYTVSSYANVFNALYSVGGPLPSGSLRDIRVVRNNKEIAHVDLYDYLFSGKCSTDVRLQNNDVIVVPVRGKTAAISGSVNHQAIYELKKEENLKSLLSYSGGVISATNNEKAHLFRVVPFAQRKNKQPVLRIVDIKLSDYLSGNKDFPLDDMDSVCIVPLSGEISNMVNLSGAVHYPGYYQCDSLSLYDLIFTYGKPYIDKSYPKRADLIRVNQDHITTTTIPVDLIKLQSDRSGDSLLRDKDQVIIYDVNVDRPKDVTVIVDGQVNHPGPYSMSTNMTLADALIRAGGFTRKALRTQVDIFRPDSSNPLLLAKKFQVALPDSLDYTGTAGRDFVLQDRDRMVVRPDPNYREENVVTITGLVKYAGTYTIEIRNERLKDLIERAGGMLPEAFVDGATVTRGEKPVHVDFVKALTKGKSQENIILLKGDAINVPPHPNSVYIYGQINNEGFYSYVKGKHLRDYIDRAGGFQDSVAYTFVTFPNGNSVKSEHRFQNPVVPEGSIIYVKKKPWNPPDQKGPAVGDIIKDTLAIIASAVTIIVLAATLKK